MIGAFRRWSLRGIILTSLSFGLALLLGAGSALVGTGQLYLAVGACLLPLVPLLVLRTQAAAVAVLASLPFDLVIFSGAYGVHIAALDFLLAATLVGVLLAVSASGESRKRLAALRPMLPLLAVYFGAGIIVFAAHPTLSGAVALVQRVELVAVPVLIGAVVLTLRSARLGLALFVTATVVVGLAFLLRNGASFLSVGKNPGGQYIADAALITLCVFSDRRVRFLVIPLLVVAAYATQSRGALIGLAVGLVLFVLLRSRDPIQAAVRGVPLALLMVAAFLVLPEAKQAQVLSNTSNTQHNDDLRTTFAKDAWDIFGGEPVLGIGLGNYYSGDPLQGSETVDPHNVLLLEAAEGGTILVAAFLVLQLGTLTIVFVRRRRSPWALVALCVQVAILVHSQVDVYWVRGTPVMGWLLIGLAMAPITRSSIPSAAAAVDDLDEQTPIRGTTLAREKKPT